MLPIDMYNFATYGLNPKCTGIIPANIPAEFYWNHRAHLNDAACMLMKKLDIDFPFLKDEEFFPETPGRAFARSIMRPLYHLVMRGEDSMANIALLLGPTWKTDGGLWCHFICRLLVLMDPEEGSVPFRAAEAFHDAPSRLKLSRKEEERIHDMLFGGRGPIQEEEAESMDTAPSLDLIDGEDYMDYTPSLDLIDGEGYMDYMLSPESESMDATPRLSSMKDQESMDTTPRLSSMKEQEQESMDTTPRPSSFIKEQESITDPQPPKRKWDPRPASEPEGVCLRRIKWEKSPNGFIAAPAPMVDF